MAEADMVERVARALAVSHGKDPDAPAWVQYPGAVPFGLCWRDQYAAAARAAIAAMREPTMNMLSAAHRNNHPRDIETWQTMIDVALDER